MKRTDFTTSRLGAATVITVTLVTGGCELWLTRDADPRTGEGDRLEQDRSACLARSGGSATAAYESCMKARGWSEAKIGTGTMDTRDAAPTGSTAPQSTPESSAATGAAAVTVPAATTADDEPVPETTGEEPGGDTRGWWKLGGTAADLERDRKQCAESAAPETADCLREMGWRPL